MRILAVALVVLAAGCASGGSGVAGAAARAQDTRLGGEFVVEMDASGGVVATCAEIPVASVPFACIQGADKARPGGIAVSASRLTTGGKTYIMVVKQSGDHRVEIMMNADGSVAGMENPLAPAEWPANVVAAASKAVPGGQVVAVEKVSGPEAAAGEEFHVKVLVDGERLRVGLTKDAKVVRVVRKIRAEVRVPR